MEQKVSLISTERVYHSSRLVVIFEPQVRGTDEEYKFHITVGHR